MQIRHATEKDLKNMRLMWLELFAYHRKFNPIFVIDQANTEATEKILKMKLQSPNITILVAEHENELMGMMVVSYTEISVSFALNKKGYVGATYVREEFRNQQVGLSLFNAAENWFKEKGADHIELQVSVKNENAIMFWKNLGFDVSTQHMVKLVGEPKHK